MMIKIFRFFFSGILHEHVTFNAGDPVLSVHERTYLYINAGLHNPLK